MRKFIILALFLFSSLHANEWRTRTLYSSLDQSSIGDAFAFYKLYPKSDYGKRALERAFFLINKHRVLPITLSSQIHLPKFHIQGMISLVNKMANEETPHLTERQIHEIEIICDHLKNRQLKGHTITDIDQIDELKLEELDLARALLLHEFKDSQDKMHDVRQYEANIDLMALQVMARLHRNASNLEKIKAINHFIFHEMRFRFPPQSISNKEIDTFTFLPSVLDSRLGVCLGVSVLYLTIAQRIGLELEIITPPGHIYLSYTDVDGQQHNIETTARGIHVPEEHYFGINTLELKHRNIRETIGLSFFNQASVLWEREKHAEAVDLYKKAEIYMPDEPLVKLFMGLNQLFIGEEEEAKINLAYVKSHPMNHVIFQDTMSDDYLKGRATPAGLKAIFKQVDETRSSIFEKQKQIQAILKTSPKFREGWFHLAVTWLQLSRLKEAKVALEKYHSLDSTNPTVEYYLSMINMERFNYEKAFDHLQRTYQLVGEHDHQKKILKGIRFGLKLINPKYAI